MAFAVPADARCAVFCRFPFGFWCQVMVHSAAAQTVLALSVVGACGLALGNLTVGRVRLGVGGVLFAGLIAASLGVTADAKVLGFVREFGLILFVYAIGLQVGPGFFSSLRRNGLPLNGLAVGIVLMGTLLTVLFAWLAGLNVPVAAGIYAGATTNTPALAAAQQALLTLAQDDSGGSTLGIAASGYALAYPLGIVGIIGSMLMVRNILSISIQKEAEAIAAAKSERSQAPSTVNLEVTNPNLDEMPLSQIPGYGQMGVVISRFMRDKTVQGARPDTKLQLGDILLAVGAPSQLEQLRVIVGKRSTVDLREQESDLVVSRILVTRTDALGKQLSDIDTLTAAGATVTRVFRSEIEFTPGSEYRLQFGDRLTVVGPGRTMEIVSEALGNSIRRLNTPSLAAMFLGIAGGVVIGSIPFTVPGLSAPVVLGLAGGPLIVSIMLSRLGNFRSLVWYLPVGANHALRELGIVLFLASVGLLSGSGFVKAVLDGSGLLWMGIGALVTVIPLLIAALVGRFLMKLNYLTLCGVLAGSMTDPPALAFAESLADSDAASVAYATVYPLTMFLRVITAQILVLTLSLAF